ncbi:hypothetical protein [Paenibacillus sp. NPDC058174]|uniref:phage lytic cycle repressor MrpR family protein n=1 Tax=Paenibacillus sp. NPDC058174 TaxID=3346366 RepID=UPI0036D7F9F1
MSNTIFDDKMYNESIKLDYMSIHKDGYRNNLKRVFKITRSAEEDYNKDLYAFTREELRKLFYTFMATTPTTSKTYVQYVSGYIDWAIEEGHYKGTNPLEIVDTAWKKQFVIKPEKVHLTDIEVKDMLKNIVEPQVAVVFYAPYLGIRSSNNSEIVNLKNGDIDTVNKTVKVYDENKNERTVEIDDQFIDLCNDAMKSNEYTKSNGNPDKNLRAQETADLISNQYVVRAVDTATTINTDESDGAAVYRRFQTIQKVFDEMDMKITPTIIMQSGMIAMAKDYLLSNGKLDETLYSKIKTQYNLNDLALKRIKNEFLNKDFVSTLYEIS